MKEEQEMPAWMPQVAWLLLSFQAGFWNGDSEIFLASVMYAYLTAAKCQEVISS